MTTKRDRSEPIEDYLDELLSCLRLPPRATRRLLTETEDHLRCAAEAAEHRGVPRVAAEQEAVARFGPARQIAVDAGAARRLSGTAAVATLAWALTLLAGVGLTAVGVSGVIASGFNLALGHRFVGALPQTYSAADCRHFLAVQPGSGNCSLAAILETSHDAVALRLLAGLLGVLLVGLAWVSRRYLSKDLTVRRMLAASISVAATVCFGAATVGLLGMSADTALQHGAGGVGWYLSGALVGLVGMLAGGALAWRHLRRLRPWNQVVALG